MSNLNLTRSRWFSRGPTAAVDGAIFQSSGGDAMMRTKSRAISADAVYPLRLQDIYEDVGASLFDETARFFFSSEAASMCGNGRLGSGNAESLAAATTVSSCGGGWGCQLIGGWTPGHQRRRLVAAGLTASRGRGLETAFAARFCLLASSFLGCRPRIRTPPPNQPETVRTWVSARASDTPPR